MFIQNGQFDTRGRIERVSDAYDDAYPLPLSPEGEAWDRSGRSRSRSRSDGAARCRAQTSAPAPGPLVPGPASQPSPPYIIHHHPHHHHRNMSAFGGTQPAKGHFLNGIWHCDCTPRIPAVHLETKKTGPNHGRWFRTCAKPREGKCKFFLWDSDAQTRENSAAPPTPNRKRKRSASGNFDDEYPLTQGDDDDLNEAMSTIETPSKVAPPNSFITPAAKRRNLPWGVDQSSAMATHGLQTPQTERRVAGDPFPSSNPTPTSSALTASQATEDDTHRFATPSTSLNRTPALNHPSNAAGKDLVNDVLGLLQRSSIRLNEHTEKELKALLKRHAKTSEGYKRGRDVMRTIVKAKDARITELTYRIGTLEAELEAEKAMVKHLEWEAQSDTSGLD